MGPLAALAKVIDNATVGGKLTDAHSEPDVRDITAHPRTFGAEMEKVGDTGDISLLFFSWC